MSNFIKVSVSDRFAVNDMVEWTSKSGNFYSGQVVSIRQDRSEDLYQRGALVTVEIDHERGIYRNFYENEVEAYQVD